MLDLSRPDRGTDTEYPQKTFAITSDSDHLELDSFLVPAGRILELSSTGAERFLSLQVAGDETADPSEVVVAWNGGIEQDNGTPSETTQLGSENWSGTVPIIEIDTPNIDGLIYNPIEVAGLSTDRLRLHGASQIATSSLIEGDIQFYFGSRPSDPVFLRTGEFIQFSGVAAQLTNLTLTPRGMQFVLVGEAQSIRVGFLANLRDINPSLLDGLLSIQSLVMIVSSIFALLLAGLSAIGLRRSN